MGYYPEYVTVAQPTKKVRGKELSEDQKSKNKKNSSIRVRGEHAIENIKKMKIVRNECRLRKEKILDSIFETGAKSHNFRLIIKSFNYMILIDVKSNTLIILLSHFSLPLNLCSK